MEENVSQHDRIIFLMVCGQLLTISIPHHMWFCFFLLFFFMCVCFCWFGAPPCVILSQTTALTFLHTVCVLINCLILPCIAAAAAAWPRFLSRTTLSGNIGRCVADLNFSSFASEGRTEAANICNGEFCVCVWGFERITRLLQLPVQERPAHIQASPHSGSVNLPRNPINYLLEVPASWPAITSEFSLCRCVLLREQPPSATSRRRDPLSLFMQARPRLMKTDFERRRTSAGFEQDSAHVGFQPPHKLTFS